MAYDPFSAQQTEPHSNSIRPKPVGSRKVFLVLGIIAGSMLVICCGFAGLSVVAVRSYTHPANTVELDERADNHSEDMEAFRSSIQQLSENTGRQVGSASLSQAEIKHPEIDAFVRDILDKIDRDEEVPFNLDMFVEAIDASHYYRGSMSMVERLTMANWLRQYAPIPENVDDYHRVIGFRRKGDRLAEIDLLFYSESNQPTSVRWFLVNESESESDQEIAADIQWQIYDHGQLEDGRRKSDEYANYLKDDGLVAEGYDNAINEAYLISADWDYENPEESIAKLRKCESARMLRDDRDIALLHFSYFYLENSEEAEAIRALKKIQNPDRMWGVWPMLAICYSSLEEHDDAIASVKKAEQQVPGHPRNRWLRGVIASAMDHEDEVATHEVAALTMMPQDTSLFWTVANRQRIADVPALVGAADFAWKQRRSMSGWTGLVDAITSNLEFADEITKAVQRNQNCPKGISEMITASAAWANSDADTAAKGFLKACGQAEHDEIKQTAREYHQQCRLNESDFAALLVETDDIDDTLMRILGWAYDEEFYESDDVKKLIDALQNSEDHSAGKSVDHPITTAILGWAHLQQGQYETALQKLDRFHKQFAEADNPKLSDDADWVSDFTDTMATQCLLSLGRPDEVLTRFEDEPWRFDQISDWFVSRRDTEKALSFLDRHQDDSRDMMRLQCLKLKAMLATSVGDVKESSRLHQEAMTLGKKIEESVENYWPGDLSRNFAHDMVLLSSNPSNVDSPSKQFYQQFFYEAAQVEDGSLVRAWADHVSQESEFNPEVRLRIAKYRGDYHISQGDFQKAIQAFTLPASDMQTDDSQYLVKSLVDAKILSQLAVSDFDAARKALIEREESVGYSSIDISPEAIADLAEWDTAALREHFEGLDLPEVASWLVETPRRRFFEQSSERPEFDDFLEAYPMPIGYHQPQQVGRLVFSSSQTPSLANEWIKSACSNALAGPVSVEAATSVQSDTAWIVKTGTGDRILVATEDWELSLSTIDQLGIATSEKQPIADGKRVRSIVTIAVLDYKPRAMKRIFDVSQSLSSLPELNQRPNQAIAFSQGGRVWTAKSAAGSNSDVMALADQLRWGDRMPVNFQTLDLYLSNEFDSDVDETEFKKSSKWQSSLKSNVDLSGIYARHACGDVWEELPVELLSVDVKKNRAMVRLKASSALSSYLRFGNTCTCQTSNLRQANP